MKSNTSYKIEIAPSAERQLKKLPKNIQSLIIKELKKLKLNPRPGITENFYRLRIRDYRIIYMIKDKKLLVLILR